MSNTIRDTSFCDAITNVYDEIELKIFINTVAKPHVLFEAMFWFFDENHQQERKEETPMTLHLGISKII